MTLSDLLTQADHIIVEWSGVSDWRPLFAQGFVTFAVFALALGIGAMWLLGEAVSGCALHGRAPDEMDGGDCPECFDAETDLYFEARRMPHHGHYGHYDLGETYVHDHHAYVDDGELWQHMRARHTPIGGIA